jgi:hypothetical protein
VPEYPDDLPLAPAGTPAERDHLARLLVGAGHDESLAREWDNAAPLDSPVEWQVGSSVGRHGSTAHAVTEDAERGEGRGAASPAGVAVLLDGANGSPAISSPPRPSFADLGPAPFLGVDSSPVLDDPSPVPRWRSKGSMNRRGYPIHAYIGANGSGKSLAMMHDTKLSIDLGRPILSTVRVLDPRGRRVQIGDGAFQYESYSGYVPLRRWPQLLEFSDGDVLFDEVLGIAASESGRALPKAVQLLLNQLRRRDILLRWTAPSWSRANIVLREVTQAVTVCRGYAKEYQASGGRMWGMNQLFRWNTYDAMEFTTWSDDKEAKLKGKQNAWAFRKVPWWWPGSHGAAEFAAASYDTFDSVDNVDSGEGYCFRCGGDRPKIKLEPCSCPPFTHE